MTNGSTDLFNSDSSLFTIGSLEVDSLTLLLVSAAVVLGVQLLLCFKSKTALFD